MNRAWAHISREKTQKVCLFYSKNNKMIVWLPNMAYTFWETHEVRKGIWAFFLVVFPMLIGWAEVKERNVGECFACLTWLNGLFVRTLQYHVQTHTPAALDPHELLLSVFRLCRSVQPPSWTQSVSQMNYEMNSITIHNCTEMYSVYSKWPEYTGECQSCWIHVFSPRFLQ